MTLTHIIACIALAIAIGTAFAAYANYKRIVTLYGLVALLNKDEVIGLLDKLKADMEEIKNDQK